MPENNYQSKLTRNKGGGKILQISFYIWVKGSVTGQLMPLQSSIMISYTINILIIDLDVQESCTGIATSVQLL